MSPAACPHEKRPYIGGSYCWLRLFTAAGLWGSDELKSHFPFLLVFNEQWETEGRNLEECMDIWLRNPRYETVRSRAGLSESLFIRNRETILSLVQRIREAVLTNCHNEWMTILMNTGLAGLFTYKGSWQAWRGGF